MNDDWIKVLSDCLELGQGYYTTDENGEIKHIPLTEVLINPEELQK